MPGDDMGHPDAASRTVSPGTEIVRALVLALVRQNLTIVTPTVLVAHVRHPTTRLPTSIAVVAARASILRG